jgi:hypothetical protein
MKATNDQKYEDLPFSGDSPPDSRAVVERYLTLAETFGVKKLTIVFSPMWGSRFEPRQNPRIVIGRADDHMIEDALDHELAHAVDYVRRSWNGHHDEVFYKTLLEVIRARGGNPATDHAWHREYRCIWLLAARDGLTTKAWERRPKLEYYIENGFRRTRWVNQPPEPVPTRRRRAS